MALQQNLISEHGIECPECYLIVDNITYVKGYQAYGQLLGYYNKASRDAHAMTILTHPFQFTYDYSLPQNIIEQAYLEIKKSELFTTALDV